MRIEAEELIDSRLTRIPIWCFRESQVLNNFAKWNLIKSENPFSASSSATHPFDCVRMRLISMRIRSRCACAINKLLPDRWTRIVLREKFVVRAHRSIYSTIASLAHTQMLNLIVKTIDNRSTVSSLSISQNSDHPSWEKQLVFVIENKNRYGGTLAKSISNNNNGQRAMTITMDIKHNTIIQYRRAPATIECEEDAKHRRRENRLCTQRRRIETLLSFEAFGMRIFDVHRAVAAVAVHSFDAFICFFSD